MLTPCADGRVLRHERALRQNLYTIENGVITHRFCTACLDDVPIGRFVAHNRNTDGTIRNLSSCCLNCYVSRGVGRTLEGRIVVVGGVECLRCNACSLEAPLIDFPKGRGTCRKCLAEKQREYMKRKATTKTAGEPARHPWQVKNESIYADFEGNRNQPQD